MAARLRLGDANAGIGGVARRLLAIEVGLGDEAAADQRLRCDRYSFWASAASARATWTCAASWLGFCDWTERSMTASAWPARTQLPASTSTRRHPAAFAGDADRLVAARGQRRRWR